MNITKFTFEEGEDIVKQIKAHCKERNIHLDCITSASGLDVQQIIRDFLTNNLQLKLKKPDYFALFALLIERENEAKRWEDVMKNVEECEFHSDIVYQCCCSHRINYVYRIINKKTKLSLLVGSECVNKYGISTLKENLKEEKRKRQYRMCEGCDKYVIGLYEPSWKKTCMKCYKKNKIHTFEAPALKSNCTQCNNTMWFNGALCDGCFQ